MEIEKNNLWICGGYYMDFDELDQFRIIGPNNHLYCGLVDIPRHKIRIDDCKCEKFGSALRVNGAFLGKQINLYYPAMDDIRTLRKVSKQSRDGRKFHSFLEIRREFFDKLVPLSAKLKKNKQKNSIIFKRNYAEDKWYKVIFEFFNDVKVERVEKPYKGYSLKTRNKEIKFQITALTNDINRSKISNVFLPHEYDYSVFNGEGRIVKKYLDRTKIEIEHLLEWQKTSGDRFGTVFPRDWMEASDLGVHDLTQEARDFMYKISLKNVNKKGESWHEDVVGEYKYQYELAGRDIFDRHMIDIEPHHIIGLAQASSDYLVDRECRQATRLIAKYVLKMARENDFITFKKLPKEKATPDQKYYWDGNWRDSSWAFKRVSQSMAPFDVNAVFYPEALRVLRNFQKQLGMRIKDIDRLIKKWDKVRKKYSFKNDDGTSAYAMAVYDIKKTGDRLNYKKFEVNHIDESYLFTYGEGTPEEIESFCIRLLDKKYFYTNSGPTLVAKNNQYGYTTTDYHGQVIWTKQVAFVVLGLSKHLKRSIVENWDKSLQRLIKKTLLITCRNMIRTFSKMDAIPELHYDYNGKPRLFTDQARVGGMMSKVQLWSAIGARRIFRKYYELMTEERYQIK